MATMTQTSAQGRGMTGEEKFVIFASSLGTTFERYDFYLYTRRSRRVPRAACREAIKP